MKKLIIIFVIIPLLSIAQEVQKVEVVKSDTQIENLNKLLGQNEIKIDFLDFIIFPALTLGYEKNRNSSTAYGATMFINLILIWVQNGMINLQLHRITDFIF